MVRQRTENRRFRRIGLMPTIMGHRRGGVTEKESQDTKLIIDNIADDVLCFVMHLL